MTWQAILFLHKFKQVQLYENGSVYFDNSKKVMITVSETPNSTVIEKDLTNSWNYVNLLLPYLKSQDLIKQTCLDSYALTYAGYHYAQTIISSALSFLIKSVAVPILVSIFTTIITAALILFISAKISDELTLFILEQL